MLSHKGFNIFITPFGQYRVWFTVRFIPNERAGWLFICA